jgi:hypothetical protein
MAGPTNLIRVSDRNDDGKKREAQTT